MTIRAYVVDLLGLGIIVCCASYSKEDRLNVLIRTLDVAKYLHMSETTVATHICVYTCRQMTCVHFQIWLTFIVRDFIIVVATSKNCTQDTGNNCSDTGNMCMCMCTTTVYCSAYAHIAVLQHYFVHSVHSVLHRLCRVCTV